MDLTWSPTDLDQQRQITFFYHPSATALQMVSGTHSDGADITALVSRASQSSGELALSLRWHDEVYGIQQTQAGRLLEARLNGSLLWWGVIESISEYRHESGVRTLSVIARARDASPAWRTVKRVTNPWPTATPLNTLADQILASLGLTPLEIDLPLVSATTVHSNTQLADMTAWEMLVAVMLPVGGAPYVDAKGRFKAVSRDVTRPADIILTPDRIKSVTSSRSALPPSNVKIKWLSPSLTKVSRQEVQIWTDSITFGYFMQKMTVPILYSDDKTQRMENVRLVINRSIKDSAVFGFGGFTERFEEVSMYEGRLILKTPWDVGLWFLYFGAAVASAAWTPDEVTQAPGFTVPTGRVFMVSALLALLLTMTKISTGNYSLFATPFDYVYGRNSTEAYNQNTPAWAENERSIENDFVMNEEMAQAFATRELVYHTRAAQTYNVAIVDDPRVEVGDILQLPDQSRVYVLGYSRDLSPGAPAILNVEGFRV